MDLIYSFSFFILLFLFVGFLSYFKSKKNLSDYFLASHNTPSWVVGLSAMATTYSGYMFTGLIGYTYLNGISVIWLCLGTFLGDLTISTFTHKPFRIRAKKIQSLSYSHLVSNWFFQNFKKLKVISSLLILIFLSTYAGAQFVAGAKALNYIFETPIYLGIFLCFVITLSYCIAGGIRASLWTDVLQSFIMISSMGLLCFFAIYQVGGLNEFFIKISLVSENFSSLVPQSHSANIFFMAVFMVSWIFSGFGVIGQPHVMSRFTSLDKPEQMKKARTYYYLFNFLFYVLSVSVGLCVRILIPEIADPEKGLLELSQTLLPSIIVGFILAGLFAALISTADSQILSCSSCLVEDFFKGKKNQYLYVKLSTLCCAIVATLIATFSQKNIFNLVWMSWSVLGGAFAPLILLYILDRKPSEKTSICMVLSALLSVIVWRYFGWNSFITDCFPSMMVPFLVYFVLEKKLNYFKK